MKNLSGILAVIIAVVLLVGGCIVGFDRGIDVGGAYFFTIQLNEKFEASDVEKIMKEAGATECLVQEERVNYETVDQVKPGTVALISFSVEDDTKAQEVFKKGVELLRYKYFLAYGKSDADLKNVSSTLNKDAVISMWPVAIIVIAMLAYVFVRFSVKMGISAIVNVFVAGAATLGIVGIAGINITGYTIPALLLACALAYGYAIVYALIFKDNSVRMEKNIAISETADMSKRIVLIISAIAAFALVLMLVLGGVMLKNFAITALIGVVIDAAVAILVMPKMANGSKKA